MRRRRSTPWRAGSLKTKPMTEAKTETSDNSDYANEPIRIPGSIQPHGYLFIVSAADQRVMAVSQNAADLLGLPVSDMIGRPVGDFLLSTTGETLDQVIGQRDARPSICVVMRHPDQPGELGGVISVDDDLLLLELQASTSVVQTSELFGQVRAAIEQIRTSPSTESACQALATGVRRLCGFERVMVYRFDDDWNGQVVAEDRLASAHSYLGQMFPASDISEPARALYLVNTVRIIPDASYRPSPIVPGLHPSCGRPFDLSRVTLRSVSPIHLEYLADMGVAASMCVSIIRDDRLWGLVACHHSSPKILTQNVLQSCDLLAQSAAWYLDSNEHTAAALSVAAVRAIELMVEKDQLADFKGSLASIETELLATTRSSGVAIWKPQGAWAVGLRPSDQELESLVEWLAATGQARVTTDRLSWLYPPASDFESQVSGLVATRLGVGWIIWFRAEWRHTLTWAGPQDQPVVRAAETGRITPRRSFASWRQGVRGRSVPWTNADLVAADQVQSLVLRASLSEARTTSRLAVAARTAYQAALDRFAIVAITDRRGDIVFVNDRFCEISGYSRDELLGRNHRILKSGQHPADFFTDLWRTLSSKQSWHGDVCNRNKSGELYWVDTTIVPLLGADGQPEQFVSVRYEITDRKASEAQRQVMLDALNECSLAAEAATIAKSQFLATMSHELRTPMNGVIGMLDLLMKTDMDAEQTLRASTALGSARSLLEILNDILDFSKLESGQVAIEDIAFSPAVLAELIRDLLGPRAEDSGLRLSCEIGPEVPHWLRGDPTRLRQVLINLVGNAIKFTESGTIQIGVSYAPLRGQGELRFEVHDTGIGVSKDQQARLFRRFVQADSTTTRRYGGTGLGLAISKELVELMGGTMGVTSSLGAGSTFWFRLDAPQAAAPSGEDAAETADLVAPVLERSLRILAADDHQVNRMVVQLYLEAAGHHVTVVGNGAEALEAVRTGHFDLVLMDIQMPVMDGLTATREIRALASPACDIPIIALTANAMAGDRERYMAAHMDDYLTKPIDPGALLGTISQYCPAGAMTVLAAAQ